MGRNLGKYNQRPLFGADRMLDRLPKLSGFMKICQDIIFPMILDTDFEGLYKSRGRPPVSPRVLMCVTILQFLEKLPDRAAARNLTYRLDWKIAIGMEIDDPGFSHQLLTVWRSRILECDAAKTVFDDLVQELVDRKLVRKCGKQRIDSTHVIADLKELSRLELITETLRLATLDLKKIEIESSAMITSLIEKYSEEMNFYQLGSTERDKILRQAGKDMMELVEFSAEFIDKDRYTKNIKILFEVFEQNFITSGDSGDPELIKIATGKDHVCSPHDPEARYGSKHKNIGYKAQIIETAEREQGNFIIDVEAEDNEETDQGKVEPALGRLKEKDLVPEKIYVDQGYVSGESIVSAKEDEVEVMGPIEDRDRGLLDDFEYDEKQDRYSCPAGYESKEPVEQKDGSKFYKFSRKECVECPMQAECRPKIKGKATDGRFVRRAKHHEEITERRELMKTEAYKEDMKNRNAIEGTISALKRGAGLVRCRYKGKAKFRLQLIMSAIAFNVKRIEIWV